MKNALTTAWVLSLALWVTNCSDSAKPLALAVDAVTAAVESKPVGMKSEVLQKARNTGGGEGGIKSKRARSPIGDHAPKYGVWLTVESPQTALRIAEPATA
jgi:hypothetical protein